MARTATTKTAPAESQDILPAIVERTEAAQDQAAAAAESARALAAQIGYEGAITVGTIEDEIRFYQRRSVEALLECGKRLLILKELTPHGEFVQRCELLGFADRTARRFMQAAAKTAKSANLAVLSTQVKSASAFLELVTHDDDELEALSDMDEIDRMSASDLREALRKQKRETDRHQSVSAELSQQLAGERAGRKKLSQRDWPQAFEGLRNQAHVALGDIEKSICLLDGIRAEAIKDEAAAGADEDSLTQAREALADQLAAGYRRAHQALDGFATLFNQTLGAFGTTEAL
ncbi:DUF3102 domain-containing protein [Ottowia oryzae]|uniref:DUF3102 domain-containing protein n=1 Tax=Ottowia oryzae TaxID=2109914 RepID=UPI001FEC9A0F|nr:DUF3102 domain-containing protein [Ottowia oryzae]